MPTTFRTVLQLPFAGIVPPTNAADRPFGSAVSVPPQVLLTMTPLDALAMPPGYTSLNSAPVIALPLLLLSVIVICEVPPTRMLVGANAFVTVGAASCAPLVTVSGAVAAMPGLALMLVTAPVSFTKLPTDVPTTLMTTSQLSLAGIVPFTSATDKLFGSAVSAPPHVLLTTTPLGALVMWI